MENWNSVKKKIGSLSVVLGMWHLLCAQEPNALLWQISGAGMSHNSYLYGTMHLIPKKDFVLRKEVKEALNKSDVAVFEANIFEMSLQEKIAMAKDMMLPEGKRIRDFMSAEEYQKLLDYCKDSLKIKEKTFEARYSKLTPFALSAVLTKKYIGKAKGYDEEIYKLAKKQKKNIGALETADFQMELIRSIPPDAQLEMLLDVRKMYEIKEMIEIYKRQDIYDLYRKFAEDKNNESGSMQEFNQKFLVQRNSNWIPQINRLHSEKPVFIAVGALHLAGPTGVIDLLRQMGYTVEPVF